MQLRYIFFDIARRLRVRTASPTRRTRVAISFFPLILTWTRACFETMQRSKLLSGARAGFPTKLRGYRERSMLADAQQFSTFPPRETGVPVGGSRKTQEGIYRCLQSRETHARAIYSLCFRRFARGCTYKHAHANERTIFHLSLSLPFFL